MNNISKHFGKNLDKQQEPEGILRDLIKDLERFNSHPIRLNKEKIQKLSKAMDNFENNEICSHCSKPFKKKGFIELDANSNLKNTRITARCNFCKKYTTKKMSL